MFLKYLTGPNAGSFAKVRPGDLIGNRSDCARIIDDIPKEVLLALIELEGPTWYLVAHDQALFCLNGENFCHAELKDKDQLSFIGSAIRLEVISPPARGVVPSRLSQLEVPLYLPESLESSKLELKPSPEVPPTEELPVTPGRESLPVSAASVDADSLEEKGKTTVLPAIPEITSTLLLPPATSAPSPQTTVPNGLTAVLPAPLPAVPPAPWLRITALSACVGASAAIITMLVLAPILLRFLEIPRPFESVEKGNQTSPSSFQTPTGSEAASSEPPSQQALSSIEPAKATASESEQRSGADLPAVKYVSRHKPLKAGAGSRGASEGTSGDSAPEHTPRPPGSIEAIAPASVAPQPAPVQARLSAPPVDVEIRAMEPNTSVQFDNRPPVPTPLKLKDIPVGRHQLTLYHSVEGLKNPLSFPLILPESARPVKIMLRLKARTLKINQEDAQRIEVP